MARLPDIPVRERPAPANALPVLHEIRHALARLVATGEATTLDLMAMPFGPADEALLRDTLGRGEVSARVEALGPTQIWETGYPGVWMLDYANPAGERIAFQIQVTELPDMLRADRAEMAAAVERLGLALDRLRPTGAPALTG